MDGYTVLNFDLNIVFRVLSLRGFFSRSFKSGMNKSLYYLVFLLYEHQTNALTLELARVIKLQTNTCIKIGMCKLAPN